MFRRVNVASFYTLLKRNRATLVYVSSVTTGLAGGAYLVSENVVSMPHYALAKNDIDLSDCLTNTITSEDVIMKNKDQMRYRMEAFITNLQGKIVKELEEIEATGVKSTGKEVSTAKKFLVDRWERSEGGGGITSIIQDGVVFERAAVNVSVVSGSLPPAAVAQMRSRGKENIPSGKNLPFVACGISSVIHPRNPHVPTLHFNYRFFQVEVGPNQYESWFGGGTDLTPYYLDEEDVKHFHKTLRSACDQHDPTHYSNFKKWCDKYFVITHRENESRGVGGIFFDDLESRSDQNNKVFDFVRECGNSVMPSYRNIIKKNMNKPYGQRERDWQLIRRGRYVEFNLVHDRGTKFGLMTPGARIESILVSLPAVATWTYKHKPEAGSPEDKLYQVLKSPRDWA